MDLLTSSPAAGFDHPLEMLDACHGRVRHYCELVGKIAAHLAAEGLDEPVKSAAASVIRYFDIAGAAHHRDEEDDLFPALLASANGPARAGVEALVERLRKDHRELENLWAHVRAPLASLAAGQPAMLDPGLARQFARAYDDHILEEEWTLLPFARHLLGRDAMARLGESMARRRGVKPPGGA